MSSTPGWDVVPNVDRYGKDSGSVHDGWHRAVAGDMTVWFQTAMGRDGRLVCTRMDVESQVPLTSGRLRRIPLSAILEELSTRPITMDDLGPPMHPTTGLRRWYDTEGAEVLMDDDLRQVYFVNSTAQIEGSDRPKRGGVGPQREDLELFAEAYRIAVRTKPTRAIAETIRLLEAKDFHISRATAHRWRDACRTSDVGLLDPSPDDPWATYKGDS